MTPRILLTAAMLLTASGAFAQDTLAIPPQPPPAQGPGQVHVFVRPQQHRDGPGGGPAEMRGFEGRGGEGRGVEVRMHGLEGPGMPGGGMPPGTWWRNQDTITRIGLSPEQQKHIDEVFLQSRVQLIDLHASLEKAQLLLEPLLDANPVDQPKALSQISKIADTRAELEKSNARMLLSIRAILTTDQWTKLRDVHHILIRGGMGGSTTVNKLILVKPQHGGMDKVLTAPPPPPAQQK